MEVAIFAVFVGRIRILAVFFSFVDEVDVDFGHRQVGLMNRDFAQKCGKLTLI